MTAIKTCVDGYNLWLISRRCKDHRHYMAWWYAVDYRCHARLTPTRVKHSSRTYLSDLPNPKYFLEGDFFWSPTPPTASDWSTCHRPSGRWVYIYFCLLHNLIITHPCRAIHICHTQTANAINVNIYCMVRWTLHRFKHLHFFLLYCCKLRPETNLLS